VTKACSFSLLGGIGISGDGCGNSSSALNDSRSALNDDIPACKRRDHIKNPIKMQQKTGATGDPWRFKCGARDLVLSLINISVNANEVDRLQMRYMVSGMHKMAEKNVVKFFRKKVLVKTGQIKHYVRALKPRNANSAPNAIQLQV
jgi:hypothetical protein